MTGSRADGHGSRNVLLTLAWLVLAGGLTSVVITAGDALTIINVAVANPLLVTCGTILVVRSDQRTMGWALVVPGMLFPYAYAAEAVHAASGASWAEMVINAAMVVVLPLVWVMMTFPSGRFVTPGFRRLMLTSAVAIITGAMLEVARVAGIVALPAEAASSIAMLILLLAILGGLVLHVRLYGNRTEVEKRQVRWFLFAIAGLSLYLLDLALPLSREVFLVIDVVATSLLPLAITVAILRYRLYDIDRIISRTVSYLIVVGLLAGVYLLAIALVTTLLPTSSSVAVALSTLAAAGLFAPIRTRVHDAVDRRFNRTQYEVQQVLDRFGREMQHVTDTLTVSRHVEVAIAHSLEPTVVGAWHRRADGGFGAVEVR